MYLITNYTNIKKRETDILIEKFAELFPNGIDQLNLTRRKANDEHEMICPGCTRVEVMTSGGCAPVQSLVQGMSEVSCLVNE